MTNTANWGGSPRGSSTGDGPPPTAPAKQRQPRVHDSPGDTTAPGTQHYWTTAPGTQRFWCPALWTAMADDGVQHKYRSASLRTTALGLGIVEQLSPTVSPDYFAIRGTIEDNCSTHGPGDTALLVPGTLDRDGRRRGTAQVSVRQPTHNGTRFGHSGTVVPNCFPR